jgi:hypothetical protein
VLIRHKEGILDIFFANGANNCEYKRCVLHIHLVMHATTEQKLEHLLLIL